MGKHTEFLQQWVAETRGEQVYVGTIDLELFKKQRLAVNRVANQEKPLLGDDKLMQGLENLLDHIYDQLVPPEGDKCPVCGEAGYTDPSECSVCEDNKAVDQ